MKKDNISIKFKDNVFCMLYRDKKNLAVTTLQGGVYMKYKNDASFVFGQDLYMFEQQASKNPNMPLRFLHYVSDVYRDMYNNSVLHRCVMIKIPVPHFVMFYNGKDMMKESETVLKLSDMFEYNNSDPELELKVRVININMEGETYNNSGTENVSQILNKCTTLREYMIFVNKVNRKKYSEDKDIRTAVTEAVDECIKESILSDFLMEHRDEVVNVSIYEYDEEGHMKVLKAEGRLELLISQIIKKVKKGKTVDTIASETEEDVEYIKPLYDVIVESAPDYDMDKIYMKIPDCLRYD